MPMHTESNTTTPAVSLSRRLKFRPSLQSAGTALKETGQFAASLPGAAIKSLDPRQIYKNLQGVINPVAGEQGLMAQPGIQQSHQTAMELAETIGAMVKAKKLSVEKAAKLLDNIPGLETAGHESVLMAFVNGASAAAGAASLGGMASGALEAAGRMVPAAGANPTVQALTKPRSLSGLLTAGAKRGMKGGMIDDSMNDKDFKAQQQAIDADEMMRKDTNWGEPDILPPSQRTLADTTKGLGPGAASAGDSGFSAKPDTRAMAGSGSLSNLTKTAFAEDFENFVGSGGDLNTYQKIVGKTLQPAERAVLELAEEIHYAGSEYGNQKAAKAVLRMAQDHPSTYKRIATATAKDLGWDKASDVNEFNVVHYIEAALDKVLPADLIYYLKGGK